jgi:hypothetical protein
MVMFGQQDAIVLLGAPKIGKSGDKDERERLRCWVGHYTLINDELFL